MGLAPWTWDGCGSGPCSCAGNDVQCLADDLTGAGPFFPNLNGWLNFVEPPFDELNVPTLTPTGVRNDGFFATAARPLGCACTAPVGGYIEFTMNYPAGVDATQFSAGFASDDWNFVDAGRAHLGGWHADTFEWQLNEFDPAPPVSLVPVDGNNLLPAPADGQRVRVEIRVDQTATLFVDGNFVTDYLLPAAPVFDRVVFLVAGSEHTGTMSDLEAGCLAEGLDPITTEAGDRILTEDGDRIVTEEDT